MDVENGRRLLEILEEREPDKPSISYQKIHVCGSSDRVQVRFSVVGAKRYVPVVGDLAQAVDDRRNDLASNILIVSGCFASPVLGLVT